MAIAEPAAPAGVPPHDEILALADGVELIGEYEGSGFKEPPLLARRADGQMIQLRRLPYLIAVAADGRRGADEVAAAVSERYGRRVSGRSVRYLVERKLRPLGVLALADGSTPELPKRAPVMALRHRRPVVSARTVNVLARGFAWLHRPVVQVLVLAALAALDAWLFGIHGIAGGLRAVLYDPLLLLAVPASIVVATAFHEIGHASACRYGGARPGVMGVGVYLIWPAFYCDVTDAYRLGRGGRLRTDLGGVYFNGIFALAVGCAGLLTGQEAFLLMAFVQHTIVLQQLLPLMRFDGYYVLSDLTGVPDILSRVKPIFRSLRPGHTEPQVDVLKPWVRAVVTVYLSLLIPALLFMFVSTVLAAPRMLATAYDSLGLQLDRMSAGGGLPVVALGTFRIGALVMPLGAIAVSLLRSGRMAMRGLAAWSSGSLPRRAAAVAAVAAVAGGAGYTWWPNGDYQPIRPGERGTIGEALASLPQAPGGRPSFTPERARRFGRVPTVREQGAVQRRSRGGTRHAGKRPASGARRRADSATPPAGEPLPEPGDSGADAEPTPEGSDPSMPADDAPPWPSPETSPSAQDGTATPSPTPSPAAATATPAAAAPADSPTPTPTPTPSATSSATPADSATPASTLDGAAAGQTPTASPTPTATP